MKYYVILISVVAAMGGLLFGFDTAVISGTLNFIQPYFDLSEAGLGWTVSSLLFGCVLGVGVAGRVGDKFGRRKTLMFAAILFLLSALGSATSTRIEFFIAARFLGGIAVGVASILSPMYIAEVAPAKHRGLLVSLNQLAIVVGIVVAFFTNYLLVDTGANNWRWMLLILAIPSTLLFISLFFVPESPRWLLSNDREKNASSVLAKISDETEAKSQLFEIKASLANKNEVTYRSLLNRKHRPILYIGIILAVFQQITGINTIMYYAPKIFVQVGQSNDIALLQTIAIGLTNLIFTIVAMLTIDRIGRKKLILSGSLGMAIILLGLSILYYVQFQESILVLVLILAYIAFFAVSLGPAIWVVVSEIFPNRTRSKGMAVSIIFLWISCIIVTISFPVMIEQLSGGTTFLIFSVVCFACFFYVLKFVPETKGKSLEDLEKELIPE